LFFIFAYFCSGKTSKHYEEINWLRNKRGVNEVTAIAKLWTHELASFLVGLSSKEPGAQARKIERWGPKGSLTARLAAIASREAYSHEAG
jgi:hypothetical protein